MKLYVLFVVILSWSYSSQTQSKLTLDEFFNSTSFSLLSLSPDGRYVLVHSRRPAWESNEFENKLWLYETHGKRKHLIEKHLSNVITPKWSPSGNNIIFISNEDSSTHWNDISQDMQYSEKKNSKTAQYLQLYNIITNELLTIDIGSELPSDVAWSNDDTSLYFATSMSSIDEDNNKNNTSNQDEWKDVIQHRQPKPSDNSIIHRIDISRRNGKISVTITQITIVNFRIAELLLVPSEKKLILSSIAAIIEKTDVLELYSLDLQNLSNLTRLTSNSAFEQNLQLSNDGKHVFYQAFSLGSNGEKLTQRRLYSIDTRNGQIERWGKDFSGSISGYTIRSEGGVYILGQLGTNVQLYIQQSSSKYLILLDGWNGTYERISSSSFKQSSSIAFTYSEFQRPEEVYFVHSIDQLRSAKALTNENFLLTQRNLPQAKVYRWINADDDDRTIEGILHYPPGQFQDNKLPLLVLIHGGPSSASLNSFHADHNSWAPIAATEGWLVFEPNYRGSTGYGDQFVNEISGHPLDRPGKDILAGIDRLIEDGIADPNRLAIGGFSYGGFLTNWLITQTKRFNAALSGAGLADHVSDWGMMDLPVYARSLNGGYPWEVPKIYVNESPMYQLDEVCTPTHIVTGANDMRVPIIQSYILERGLHYLEVPVKLLLFPNEGHGLSKNPWHGKIKVREELKWLAKYGHSSSNQRTN